MGTALILTAVMALTTFLLIRSGELKLWHVLLIGVLGIFLDRIGWADPAIYAVMWLAQGLTHTTT
ncbi:hypothetical protein ACFRAR_13335 [Kitasatospora sp. NPDC056651]|uniref:hypothetical protein n=1 Tax=Kitasatospora sp. NPDC056651 TaxID=3345892 RepID=UPI0036CA9CEC